MMNRRRVGSIGSIVLLCALVGTVVRCTPRSDDLSRFQIATDTALTVHRSGRSVGAELSTYRTGAPQNRYASLWQRYPDGYSWSPGNALNLDDGVDRRIWTEVPTAGIPAMLGATAISLWAAYRRAVYTGPHRLGRRVRASVFAGARVLMVLALLLAWVCSFWANEHFSVLTASGYATVACDPDGFLVEEFNAHGEELGRFERTCTGQYFDPLLDARLVKLSNLGVGLFSATSYGFAAPTFGHVAPDERLFPGRVEGRSVRVPFWSAAFGACVLEALAWFPALWRQRRRRQSRCVHCGYDLRASLVRCPECGRERERGTNMEAAKRISS